MVCRTGSRRFRAPSCITWSKSADARNKLRPGGATMRAVWSLFVAVTLAAGASQADLPVKKVLTLNAAKQIAATAEAEAVKRGATVVIAVVDDGGHLILLERLDDTQVASVEVAIGKARTAAIFRRPSKVFEDQI